MNAAIGLGASGATLTVLGTLLQFWDWRHAGAAKDLEDAISDHIDGLELAEGTSTRTGDPGTDAATGGLRPAGNDLTFDEIDKMLDEAAAEARRRSLKVKLDARAIAQAAAEKRRPLVFLAWALILIGAMLQLVGVLSDG